MKRLAPILVVLGLLMTSALPHDEDHDHDAWYKSLMMPDFPKVPCCALADAYWADKTFVKDGKTYAVVTDDRNDANLGRDHVDVGREFEIPDNKLKWDRGNPTGHSILFLSQNDAKYVLCFVQGTGS